MFSSLHSRFTIFWHILVLQSTSNSGMPKLTSSMVHSSGALCSEFFRDISVSESDSTISDADCFSVACTSS
uniref:Putative secreted peptide n=1 Tax=Anopheles braziliensis TaxID=58242 RepID=A0A2M3ZSF9_9DIPT